VGCDIPVKGLEMIEKAQNWEDGNTYLSNKKGREKRRNSDKPSWAKGAGKKKARNTWTNPKNQSQACEAYQTKQRKIDRKAFEEKKPKKRGENPKYCSRQNLQAVRLHRPEKLRNK